MNKMAYAAAGVASERYSCFNKFMRISSHMRSGTYPVQSTLQCKHRTILLRKVSKNSEKNHECTSQPIPSIYKTSWSNSSYSNSYKNDKFKVHLNYYCLSEICYFHNC